MVSLRLQKELQMLLQVAMLLLAGHKHMQGKSFRHLMDQLDKDLPALFIAQFRQQHNGQGIIQQKVPHQLQQIIYKAEALFLQFQP